MTMERQDRRARAEGANRDDHVGEWKDPPGAIQLPNQLLGLRPNAMIRRDMDEQVKERTEISPRIFVDYPSKNFTTH